jgi:hypothetical protein
MLGPMSAAERKQRQREREADQARRREPLETKRDHAQALAFRLLASAQDLAAKLAVERNVSITFKDIARHLIGLDGTEHVRAALEGKAVTLPPAPATETVTPNVTKREPDNVTSDVTVLACFLCGKGPDAERYMFVMGDRALCSECAEGKELVAEAFEEIALAVPDLFETRFEWRLDRGIETLKAIVDDPEIELGGTPDQIIEQLNEIGTLAGDIRRALEAKNVTDDVTQDDDA